MGQQRSRQQDFITEVAKKQIEKSLVHIEDAVDLVIREYVDKNNVNMFPPSLLELKELRTLKEKQKLSQYGFEKSKPPIESESEQQIGQLANFLEELNHAMFEDQKNWVAAQIRLSNKHLYGQLRLLQSKTSS